MCNVNVVCSMFLHTSNSYVGRVLSECGFLVGECLNLKFSSSPQEKNPLYPKHIGSFSVSFSEHRSVAEEVEVCSDVFKEKNKHDE